MAGHRKKRLLPVLGKSIINSTKFCAVQIYGMIITIV